MLCFRPRKVGQFPPVSQSEARSAGGRGEWSKVQEELISDAAIKRGPASPRLHPSSVKTGVWYTSSVEMAGNRDKATDQMKIWKEDRASQVKWNKRRRPWSGWVMGQAGGAAHAKASLSLHHRRLASRTHELHLSVSSMLSTGLLLSFRGVGGGGRAIAAASHAKEIPISK